MKLLSNKTYQGMVDREIRLKNTIYDLRKDIDEYRKYLIEDEDTIQRLKVMIEELKEQLKYHTPDENIAYFKGKNESKMKINRLRSEIKELKEEKQEWINLLDMFKNQQKEFIEWLEENYKNTQDIWYIKILNKYKEIIGGKE